MGQPQSHLRRVSQVSESEVEESRKDAFSLWPGLEYHLDLSFNSLDTDLKGTLSYTTLEPVLRHHLMQIGLIEYVTRFVTPEGKLQVSEVQDYLTEYGIDIRLPLTSTDWKNLALAWIRRVQDAQTDDIQEWRTALKEMQDEQASNYQHAMRQFQKHYIEQLEKYYKTVETAHRQEEEYRMEWETSLGLQEEFYNTQMEFLQSKNLAADTFVLRKKEAEAAAEKDILKHIKTTREFLPDNITATTFAYPADITSTGAPVSGGAQVPTRRPLKRGQRPVCC